MKFVENSDDDDDYGRFDLASTDSIAKVNVYANLYFIIMVKY